MKTLKLMLLSSLALGLPLVTQTAAATHRNADVLRLDLPVLARDHDRLPVRRMLRERHGINPDRYHLRAVVVHSSHSSRGRVHLVVDGVRSEGYRLHGRDQLRIPAPSRGDDRWQLRYTPGSNLHRVTAVLEPRYDHRTYVQDYRVDRWVDHWLSSFNQPRPRHYNRHYNGHYNRHYNRHYNKHARHAGHYAHGLERRHQIAAAKHRHQAHKHARKHAREARKEVRKEVRREIRQEARREHRREKAHEGWRFAHGKPENKPERVQEHHRRVARQNHDENRAGGRHDRDGKYRQRDL